MNGTKINSALPILAVIFAVVLVSHNSYAALSADSAYLIEVPSTTLLPASPQAGDVVSVAVNLMNKGYSVSASDLNAALDLDNQFEPLSMEAHVDSLMPQATKTVVFKFKVNDDTPQGYYSAFLTLSYIKNGGKTSQNHTFAIPVAQTGSEKSIDVTVTPKVINPGNQTNVMFTLNNVGGTPISNITFSWSEESGLVLPLGSDNSRYVQFLPAGGTEDVNYVLAADPSIEPGIYPLDITMKFSEAGGTKTQSSQVGIIVGGTTDFEISAELSSSQISISIANIGSNNAAAVVVRVPKQDGVRVSGSSTAILGNLNKGDFTLANFTLLSQPFQQSGQGVAGGFPSDRTTRQGTDSNMAAGMGNINSLLLEMDYTDTTGERQTVKKTVQISMADSGTGTTGTTSSSFAGRAGRSSDSLGLIPWGLLALIVIGAAAFNRFRAGNANWKKLATVLAVAAALFLAAIFLLGSSLLSVAAVTVVSVLLLAWFFHFGFISKIAEKLSHLRKKQGK